MNTGHRENLNVRGSYFGVLSLVLPLFFNGMIQKIIND
jgi:hypothetical protein